MSNEELDALVAEKIMGNRVEHWTQETLASTDEDGTSTTYDLRTGYVLPDKPGTPDVPPYSRSWDAVYDMIHHLLEIPRKSDAHPPTNWVFFAEVLRMLQPDQSRGSQSIMTLQEFCDLFRPTKSVSCKVLCVAALRTVGVDIDV